MKKINVSQDRCIGCGACVAIDPEHFEFNDEGKSNVLTNENLESENLVNAIESCPTSAIEMTEEENKESTPSNENTETTPNEMEETTNEENCNCETCPEECECTDCECEECEHHKMEEEEQN